MNFHLLNNFFPFNLILYLFYGLNYVSLEFLIYKFYVKLYIKINIIKFTIYFIKIVEDFTTQKKKLK